MSLEEFRAHPDIISDPYLLELVKTETDFEAIKSGEAIASNLGALTEALVPGNLGKWIPGITTPDEAVDNMVKELMVIEGDLREQGRLAEQGNVDPYISLNKATIYEDRILELESKIRIMITQSAELKNAPEGVDVINQKIQGIYNNIDAMRGRAAQGTIERGVLNPDQAFLEFQKMKAGK